MIINLTQHKATTDQLAAGVKDFSDEDRVYLSEALNFSSVPTMEVIYDRVEKLNGLAHKEGHFGTQVMIGGALWLMAPLIRRLMLEGFRPVFAFSVRESVDEVQADGSVKKVAVFKHAGFVEAIL